MHSPLVETVARHTAAHGRSPYVTAVPGLTLLRAEQERQPVHLIYKPALCLVVQGAKWSTFGDRRFDYGPGQALVVSVEMPGLSRVVQASPTEPYLGVILEFDLAAMSEVLSSLDPPPPPATGPVDRGVFVGDFGDGPLADCVLRLVRLLDTPRAIAELAPLALRELSYWLLAGPNGGEIARLALGSGHAQRVVRAVNALRDRFAEAVRVEDLAAVAQLSPSAFHRQFKALTSMTPLQYQKQLRLVAARNLLVAGEANVEAAAFRVGYESPSQFSREYARLFGAPPRRDVAALRTASAGAA